MALMINGKEVDALALGGSEFYSIASSDTSVTANGKTYYAVPSEITIKQGISLSFYASVSLGIETGTVASDTVVDCVGAHDDNYFFVGSLSILFDNYAYDADYSENVMVGVVAKSNCKNIVW